MFSPFPGFEELELRMEVEFDGRTRPVEVRIESLPTSPPRATPVCSFLDAPEQGQWLLVNSERDIYTLGNPFKLFRPFTIYHAAQRRHETRVELDARRVERLRLQIERAFQGKETNMRAVCAVELSDLPREPRIAFLSATGTMWCRSWKPQHDEVAVFSPPEFDFPADGAHLKDWLQERWNDPSSDARFAWEWASWSEEERVARSTGLPNGASEVEQVMLLILRASHEGWQQDWSLFSQAERRDEFWFYDGERDTTAIVRWQKWLWAHFLSDWRADWVGQFLCAREFWEHRALAQVWLDEPSTMHERLEAPLELRDWLQGKAMPDEIEKLLLI